MGGERKITLKRIELYHYQSVNKSSSALVNATKNTQTDLHVPAVQHTLSSSLLKHHSTALASQEPFPQELLLRNLCVSQQCLSSIKHAFFFFNLCEIMMTFARDSWKQMCFGRPMTKNTNRNCTIYKTVR